MDDPIWCRHLVETLHSFQQQDYLCDMDIVAGDGTVFTAHSCVMAAASSVCAVVINMWKTKPRLQDGKPRLKTTISSELLAGVIQIVYTGKFKLDVFQLEALSCALAELGVQDPVNQALSDAFETNTSSDADSIKQNMVESEDCCVQNASTIEATVKLEPPAVGYYGPYLAEVTADNHTQIADDPTSGGTNLHSTESASLDASFQSERKREVRLLLKESKQQAESGVLGGRSIEFQKMDAVDNVVDRCAQDVTTNKDQIVRESLKMKVEAAESDIEANKTVNTVNLASNLQRDDISNEVSLKSVSMPMAPKEVHKYTCDKCDKQFTTKMALDQHLEDGHTVERPFDCPVCDAKFKGKVNLRSHLHSVHRLSLRSGNELVELTPRVFQCGLCPQTFKRTITLERHQAVHSKVKSYSCESCGTRFSFHDSLIAHIKRNLVSAADNPSSSDSTELSSGHSVLACKPKPLPSSVRNKNGLYACDKCDKQFRSKQGYERHVEAGHTDARPYPCPVCGAGFKAKLDMSIHLRYTHKLISKSGQLVDLKETYQCELCPKSFMRRLHLQNHQAVHSNARPFSCDFCGKSFKTCSALQSHVNAMHTSKPKAPPPVLFWCSQCGKGYRYKTSLVDHERSHSGERPYSCRQCGKTFRTNSNRRAHEETHRDTTEYQCPTCGKSFKRRIALYAHERVHNDARPHPCDICGKGFKTRFHRDRHLETVHKATTTATGGVAGDWSLGDSSPEGILSG